MNETEVMRDWLASSEEQLRQRDDSIRRLQSRLEAYEALVLPTEQIAGELRAQWPVVQEVTLARAENTVLLVLTTEPVKTTRGRATPALSEEDIHRIQNWLSVRLQVPSVEVFLK